MYSISNLFVKISKTDIQLPLSWVTNIGLSEILNWSSVIQVRLSRPNASTRYSKTFLPLRRLERMPQTRKMSTGRAKSWEDSSQVGHGIDICTSSSLNQESDLFGCSPHITRYWVVFVWRPASCLTRTPRSRKRCSSISGILSPVVSRASVASLPSVSSPTTLTKSCWSPTAECPSSSFCAASFFLLLHRYRSPFHYHLRLLLLPLLKTLSCAMSRSILQLFWSALIHPVYEMMLGSQLRDLGLVSRRCAFYLRTSQPQTLP